MGLYWNSFFEFQIGDGMPLWLNEFSSVSAFTYGAFYLAIYIRIVNKNDNVFFAFVGCQVKRPGIPRNSLSRDWWEELWICQQWH